MPPSEPRWKVLPADVRKKGAIPIRGGLVDAVVCDPPYEIDLHGMDWDDSGVATDPATWRHIHYVAKPGAWLLAFGSPRRHHRVMCAIEDAGWEIRDTLLWLHAQGFPRQKTVLKPAMEPIILAQKKRVSTVTKSVADLGVGLLQIDRSKVNGLWPTNVILDETIRACVGKQEFSALSRFLFVSKPTTAERDHGCEALPMRKKATVMKVAEGEAPTGKNFHPTVKPLSLMEYLCGLVTPPKGLVYDPFTGSGTTGVAAMRMGFRFIGTELNPEYITIAKARISKAAGSAAAKANF